jgi:hypothetical protein
MTEMPGSPAKKLCALCGRVGRPLETIEVEGRALLACQPHAAMAREAKASTLEELIRLCGIERRRDGRRSEIERRAFWRPTPDRRREPTETGRRSSDP